MSLYQPTYSGGFATSAVESERPGLWGGLVGLWAPTLGPTGLTLRDQSMHHNHGTLMNMDPATDWVTSPYGWALDFRDLAQYVSLPYTSGAFHDAFDATFTLVAIAQSRRTDITGWIFDKPYTTHSGVLYQVSLEFRHNGIMRARAWQSDAYGTYLNADMPYVANRWYHIAATYDINAPKLELFVDGQSKAVDTTSTGTYTNYAHGAALGRLFNMDGNELDGQIAQFLLYDRVLLPAEIADLYADPFAMLRRRQVVIPSGGIARPLVNGSLASGNVGLVA